MAKSRYGMIDLREMPLNKTFEWIRTVKSCLNPFPLFCESYRLSFRRYLSFYDRKKFEEFLSELYETKKGQNQVICCWQELGMSVIIFKSF